MTFFVVFLLRRFAYEVLYSSLSLLFLFIPPSFLSCLPPSFLALFPTSYVISFSLPPFFLDLFLSDSLHSILLLHSFLHNPFSSLLSPTPLPSSSHSHSPATTQSFSGQQYPQCRPINPCATTRSPLPAHSRTRALECSK
jgi:hypothetical protein